jgi:signal peptidase II
MTGKESGDASTHRGRYGPARTSLALKLPWHRDSLLLSTIVAVFVVDQTSKYLIKTNLPLYQSWPDEGIFRLTHGTNTGTVFGLLPNQTFFLILASLLAIGFLYYFYKTHALPSRLLRLSTGLLLGGAFGNLIDRAWAGEVVDFIDVGRWPVFNLADSSITVGIALLVATVLFTKDAGQEHRASDAPAGPDQ